MATTQANSGDEKRWLTRRKYLDDFEYRHAAVATNLDLDFAFQLRALRASRGWTQEELAERAGLKQSSVSRLEARDEFPTKRSIEKLAKAFDIAYVFKFVSFDEFIEHTRSFSMERKQVPPYAAERSDTTE